MDRKDLEKKYSKEISQISKANNVDVGVAADMFIHNMAVITAAADGAGLDWYRGGTLDAVMADYRVYKKSLPK